MPTKLQSLWRDALTWMRIVLPPSWAIGVFITGLLFWEFTAHVAFHGIRHWEDIAWHDATVAMHNPRHFWLGWGLAAYGLFRVVAKHPFFRPAYAEWLSRTPWHPKLPLPLGPVRLIPQDGVILLLAWLVTLDNSRWGVHSLVTFLLIPFLLSMIVPLRLVGAKVHAYVIAFGLATALWIGVLSPSATLLLLGLYLVAWHGLAASLNSVAWSFAPLFLAQLRPNQSNRQNSLSPHPTASLKVVNYPFAQLSPRPALTSITITEALLVSWLAPWWLFAIASNFTEQSDRDGFCRFMAILGIVLAATCRAGIYFTEYRPPITLLGRLATRRWIIPGFDHAWLPTFVAMLLAIATYRMPFDTSSTIGPLALGLGLTLVLALPPSLKDWALTGNHQIVPSPSRKNEFIEL